MGTNIKAKKLFAFDGDTSDDHVLVSTKIVDGKIQYNINFKSGKKDVFFAGARVAQDASLDAKLEPLDKLEAACAWLRQQIAEFKAMTPEQIKEAEGGDEDGVDMLAAMLKMRAMMGK